CERKLCKRGKTPNFSLLKLRLSNEKFGVFPLLHETYRKTDLYQIQRARRVRVRSRPNRYKLSKRGGLMSRPVTATRKASMAGLLSSVSSPMVALIACSMAEMLHSMDCSLAAT